MIKDPNILVTNYCNQNCSFCFAGREMSNLALKKEMKIRDFEGILKKLSPYKKQVGIKLLGGEPTLHSKLFEILDMAVNDKLFVQIFTNGVIGNDKVQKLASYGKKIGYTFNVSTPGFQINKKLRQEVINNILLLSKKSRITLSVTIDQFFDKKLFFASIDALPLTSINNIRLGFSNPIMGVQNMYEFKNFSKIGSILVDLIKSIRQRRYLGELHMNCGFTKCMFTEEQLNYIKNKIPHINWSCFGKESSMDISVDTKAFHCFPLSEQKRVNLKNTTLVGANKILMKERMKLWARLKKSTCQKCKFYGFEKNKCPGPCLAFWMNEKNK